MAGISPIGSDWVQVRKNLFEGRGSTRHMPEWAEYENLNTQLACPVLDFHPQGYSRVKTRSLGRVAFMAVSTSEQALRDAGLLGCPEIRSGAMGVAYGSSTGSPPDIAPYVKMRLTKKLSGINATTYIRMMSHTCAANIALFFELKGRVIPTCSACTSGSQGIGYAYESIKHGYQDMMLAGGAEELCVTESAVFDVLFATSTRNQSPSTTPRPFDRDRDGLVIGEGAATLVLEELEHAQRRGANIYAEIVGFATNCDGAHVTRPSQEMMRTVMLQSLNDAGLSPTDIGYINAHATATEAGDIAESCASADVFGSHTPLGSLKGYLGHTLGASGSLESWMSIQMMNEGTFAHNLNLDNIDPRCGNVDYILDEPRKIDVAYIMNNNFAFGGINTSLIFKRWP